MRSIQAWRCNRFFFFRIILILINLRNQRSNCLRSTMAHVLVSERMLGIHQKGRWKVTYLFHMTAADGFLPRNSIKLQNVSALHKYKYPHRSYGALKIHPKESFFYIQIKIKSNPFSFDFSTLQNSLWSGPSLAISAINWTLKLCHRRKLRQRVCEKLRSSFL